MSLSGFNMTFPYPLVVLLTAMLTSASPQNGPRRVSVALLESGEATIAHSALTQLSTGLSGLPELSLVDADQARMAARGIGYSGSLNMTLREARDLGAALGCDYYIISDSRTLRRSPSNDAPYYEAYSSIFLVSARTGKLITWSRPSFQAATPQAAEKLLLA